MLTVKSKIYFVSQAVTPLVSAVQGDNGRSFLFTVADWTFPTGATAEYHIRQPSGTASSGSATIEENKIQVDLSSDDTAEVGDNFGQIRVTADGLTVTSYDFILSVEKFRG